MIIKSAVTFSAENQSTLFSNSVDVKKKMGVVTQENAYLHF